MHAGICPPMYAGICPPMYAGICPPIYAGMNEWIFISICVCAHVCACHIYALVHACMHHLCTYGMNPHFSPACRDLSSQQMNALRSRAVKAFLPLFFVVCFLRFFRTCIHIHVCIHTYVHMYVRMHACMAREQVQAFRAIFLCCVLTSNLKSFYWTILAVKLSGTGHADCSPPEPAPVMRMLLGVLISASCSGFLFAFLIRISCSGFLFVFLFRVSYLVCKTWIRHANKKQE